MASVYGLTVSVLFNRSFSGLFALEVVSTSSRLPFSGTGFPGPLKQPASGNYCCCFPILCLASQHHASSHSSSLLLLWLLLSLLLACATRMCRCRSLASPGNSHLGISSPHHQALIKVLTLHLLAKRSQP